MAGMWKHHTRRTKIALCIDDFGVQYHSKEDLKHFLLALKKHYEYHLDKSGEQCIGLTVRWNWKKEYSDVSMPSYINKLLSPLKHPPPSKPQHSSYEHLPYVVGAKEARDQSPKVDEKQKK